MYLLHLSYERDIAKKFSKKKKKSDFGGKCMYIDNIREYINIIISALKMFGQL